MIRYLRWGTFFLVVLFPAVMPLALGQRGQRDVTQRTSTVQAPLNLDGATWAITGSLNTARFLHTATVLPNGVAVSGWVEVDLTPGATQAITLTLRNMAP